MIKRFCDYCHGEIKQHRFINDSSGHFFTLTGDIAHGEKELTSFTVQIEVKVLCNQSTSNKPHDMCYECVAQALRTGLDV